MAICSVVATNACKAPAGYLSGLGYARGRGVRLPRCFQCGEPVCRSCSTAVGRSQLCFTCQNENSKVVR